MLVGFFLFPSIKQFSLLYIWHLIYVSTWLNPESPFFLHYKMLPCLSVVLLQSRWWVLALLQIAWKLLLLWFMVVTDHSTLVMGSFSQSCFICTQLILFCGVQFICKIALWVLFLIRSVALCQMSPFIDPWENVILCCCCSSTWIANL